MGLFSKIKNAFSGKDKSKQEEIKNYDKGLEKSRREFVSQLSNLSKKYKNIDDNYFEELENILIMADIGVNTVMTFVDRLRDRVKKEKITDSNVLKEIIVDELFVMYVGNNIIDSKIHMAQDGPTVVLFVGVNGVGKTTTIGKLASMYKEKGKKVMLVAGDTFRAGAIEQLIEWGEKTNTKVISGNSKDPSSVIYDALEIAKKDNYDMVMIDTAGTCQDQFVKTADGFYESIYVAHALFIVFAKTPVWIVNTRETRNGGTRGGISGHIIVAFVVDAGMTPGQAGGDGVILADAPAVPPVNAVGVCLPASVGRKIFLVFGSKGAEGFALIIIMVQRNITGCGSIFFIVISQRKMVGHF